jgi:hypothetical protein
LLDPGAFPSGAYVLARESETEDVDSRHVSPVDLGDVPKVGYVGVSVGQNFGCGFVDLAVPHHRAAEHMLDGHVEAAGPGE